MSADEIDSYLAELARIGREQAKQKRQRGPAAGRRPARGR